MCNDKYVVYSIFRQQQEKSGPMFFVDSEEGLTENIPFLKEHLLKEANTYMPSSFELGITFPLFHEKESTTLSKEGMRTAIQQDHELLQFLIQFQAPDNPFHQMDSLLDAPNITEEQFTYLDESFWNDLVRYLVLNSEIRIDTEMDRRYLSTFGPVVSGLADKDTESLLVTFHLEIEDGLKVLRETDPVFHAYLDTHGILPIIQMHGHNRSRLAMIYITEVEPILI